MKVYKTDAGPAHDRDYELGMPSYYYRKFYPNRGVRLDFFPNEDEEMPPDTVRTVRLPSMHFPSLEIAKQFIDGLMPCGIRRRPRRC